MSSNVNQPVPSVQPNEGSQRCPACSGRGYIGEDDALCSLCEGFGRITVVLRETEPEPEPEPDVEPMFVATQGTAFLDADPLLEDLVSRLCMDWILEPRESVILWKGPKAVALLHSSPQQKNALRWL